MRVMFLVLLALIITSSCYAQGAEYLYPIEAGGAYGFIDEGGKLVIPPKYDSVGEWRDGLCNVGVKDGFIFINAQGRQAIRGQYDFAGSFNDGLALVKKGKKTFFIDEKGKAVIDVKYERIWPFKGGVARFLHGQKYGVIDKKGKVVVNSLDQLPQEANEEMFVVEEQVNGEWSKALFSVTGKRIAHLPGSFGLSVNCGRIPFTREGAMGFYDSVGKVAIPPIYNKAEEFHEGLAAVQVNGKWGIIDTSGRWVKEPTFENVFIGYMDGFIPVQTGGKYGLLDRKGVLVEEPRYDFIVRRTLRDQYVWVNGFGNRFALLQIGKGLITDFTFNDIGEAGFLGELAQATVNEKKVYINKHGEVVAIAGKSSITDGHGKILWKQKFKVRPGDETHCGMVIEVKPLLAKVQTTIGERWFRMEQLLPQGEASCSFVNGQYVEP